MLGDIFNRHGVLTQYLEASPTAQNLKDANIYVIVDPDTEKETTKPNFMNAAAADVIAAWVKSGGVLVLMANDSSNAELRNFNVLASKFGVRFNIDLFNPVINNQYEQGAITVSAKNPVFKTARKVFIKELATLELSNPATAILTKEGKNVVATIKYGKGTVFIVGDPWLYNEYVDGRRPSFEFDNYKAAEDLVRWTIVQSNKK